MLVYQSRKPFDIPLQNRTLSTVVLAVYRNNWDLKVKYWNFAYLCTLILQYSLIQTYICTHIYCCYFAVMKRYIFISTAVMLTCCCKLISHILGLNGRHVTLWPCLTSHFSPWGWRNLPAADNLGPGSISHSILQRWRLLLSKCEIIIHKAGFRQSFMVRFVLIACYLHPGPVQGSAKPLCYTLC